MFPVPFKGEGSMGIWEALYIADSIPFSWPATCGLCSAHEFFIMLAKTPINIYGGTNICAYGILGRG
jgi:hypothetical protein